MSVVGAERQIPVEIHRLLMILTRTYGDSLFLPRIRKPTLSFGKVGGRRRSQICVTFD